MKTKNVLYFIFFLCLIFFAKIDSSNALFSRQVEVMANSTDNLNTGEKSNSEISENEIEPMEERKTALSKDDILFAYGECSETNCKSPNGQCTDQTTCRCNYGFAQIKETFAKLNETSCSYELKSQQTFFAIELFTWIGAGHFYAGRMINGIVKLTYLLFVILLDCLLKKLCFNKVIGTKGQKTALILIYTLYSTILAWQIADIILIGINQYKDGNGYPLKSWDTFQL
jgi:hypothetical protein